MKKILSVLILLMMISPAFAQQQGSRVKSLEERRQERFAEQYQRMNEAGINIRQIQPQQQNNVMNIQPENIQQMGRQYQDNRTTQGLQNNGAPASQGNYGTIPTR